MSLIGESNAATLPKHLHRGLSLLIQAHDYARELGRDRWDFAVEISVLQRAGLTHSDYRWLVCQGLVEHAREVSVSGSDRREFEPEGRLSLSRQSCFVLTEAGVPVASAGAGEPVDWNSPQSEPEARSWCRYEQLREVSPALTMARNLGTATNGSHAHGSNGTERRDPPHSESLTPRWDKDRHQLSIGSRLVKEFKVPSPNQETVLMAFEEEAWPPRIDDPLPPVPNVDSKRRLRDTIKSLNRHQKHRFIRFMGDGTGEGITWGSFLGDAAAANG